MPKNTTNINKFQENEKVLCYHGPLLYEAKCIKIQIKEKQVKYFVHYQGWNKSWDEWVPEDRVLKINESAIQKQLELQQLSIQNKGKQSKSGKKKSVDPKDKEVLSPNVSTPGMDKTKLKLNTSNVTPNVISSNVCETKENTIAGKESDGQRRKRVKVEPTLEHDSAANKWTKSAIDPNIKLPDNLKQFLVDDWDLIRQKKLVRLPVKVSVDRIINDYIKQKNSSKTTSSKSKESIIKEAANGIKEYFNACLGSHLLYKLEKNQYKDQIKDEDESKASSIYGAIHLLRLFVKLGGLMAYLNLDEKSSDLITKHLHDFIEYLERNPSLFNTNDYETASAEYLKKCS